MSYFHGTEGEDPAYSGGWSSRARGLTDPMTKGRLNRMFKYFKGTPVETLYEYNNSLGGHCVRRLFITYDSFEIRGSLGYYHVILFQGDSIVGEQEFDNGWEFIGLGKLQMCNSGPYCFFSIVKQRGFAKVCSKVIDWLLPNK